MKLSLILLLICGLLGCQSNLKTGAERWQKFIDMEPEEAAPFSPTLTSDKGVYKPQEPIVINVSAGTLVYFYVFLMLPNQDIYLLTPGDLFKDHRGLTLTLPSAKDPIELYAPKLVGTVYIGVIASPQNLNVISEGWLPARDLRKFDTWPADLAFDDALDFMVEAFDEKPWALMTSRFVISN